LWVVGLAGLCGVVWSGCSGGDDTRPPGRGIVNEPVVQAVSGGAVGHVEREHEVIHAPPSERVVLEAVPPEPIVVQQTIEEAGETVIVRDPSAELREALGDPVGCLGDADRRLGRDIAFQVEVDVLRSGMIVDARTTAPGVSDEAIECVRRRALGARFDPFESARAVQTALILRQGPTKQP